MSLREMAQEIKAHGEAQRGDYTPSGVPAQAYAFWLKNSKTKKAESLRWGDRKENFCHYWRVVLFWAAFMKVRHGLAKVGRGIAWLVENPVFQITVGLAALAAFVFALMSSATFVDVVVDVLVGAFVTVLVAFSAISGWVMGYHGTSHEDLETENYKFMRPILKAVVVLGVLGIPVFAISRLVRDWKPEWTEFFEKIGPTMVFATIVVIIGSLIVWLAAETHWWAPLVVIALVASFFSALYAISRVLVFARDRVVAFTDAEAEKYEQALREGTIQPRVQKQGPGRVKRFFYAAADFFVLIGQAIRVNKWKICPTVTIDTKV